MHAALLAGAATLKLGGAELAASKAFGVVATLRPGGDGAGGAARLPATLRAQLRPIDLAAPSLRAMCEAGLLVGGFAHPGPLAERAVGLHALLAVSPAAEPADAEPDSALPSHCPRALFAAVHLACAALRRAAPLARDGGGGGGEIGSGGGGGGLPLAQELRVLRAALLEAYGQRLAPQDTPQLEAALTHACGAVPPQEEEEEQAEEHGEDAGDDDEEEALREAVRDAASMLRLVATPALEAGCEALHAALAARPSVLLLGGAGCGKTSCYRALRHALLRRAAAALQAAEEEEEE